MIFAVPSVLKVIGGRNFILGGFLEIKNKTLRSLFVLCYVLFMICQLQISGGPGFAMIACSIMD